MKKSIPVWLTIIIIIETLPMFIGPLVAIFNPSLMPGFSGSLEVTGPAVIYAIRNFAVGMGFLVAFALKDKHMLFILILIRLITDLLDFPTGLYFNAFSSTIRVTLIFTILYYIPAIYALRYLWKEMKEEG